MRSRATAALVTVLAVLPAGGCFQGSEGTVNSQPPTGNGTDFEVGDSIMVQDATIVAADSEGTAGSLLFTVINDGVVDDALVAVSTEPSSSSSLDGRIDVPSGHTVRVSTGSDAEVTLTGLGVPTGSYATVTFSFLEAGESTQQVAVVPDRGYYAGLAPAGAEPEAEATGPTDEPTSEEPAAQDEAGAHSE